MGWFSRIRKFAKAVIKAAAKVVGIVIRAVVGLLMIFPLKFVEILLSAPFAFFGLWPPKKIRLHIAILKTGPNDYDALVVNKEDLWPAIRLAQSIFQKQCGVEILPYSSGNETAIENWAQVVDEIAPEAALRPHCDSGLVKDEFNDAGSFFLRHVAGWVYGILPHSLYFPITVYVVEEIESGAKTGCSAGLLSDYITISAKTILAGNSTLAHEIGHACNLTHFLNAWSKQNLMHESYDRVAPFALRFWQAGLVRASRHVTYI